MNIDIQSLKSITKHKIIYPLIFLMLINIGIIIGLYFMGNTLYQKFLLLQATKDEIAMLKSRVVLISNNREIFKGSLDEYNETLSKLIPDQESYFSVITALDALANKTGVKIAAYSIDLKATTEEKLTLLLAVEGDQAALNKLLAEYMFISGRLITNEESSIILDQEEQTLSISFNFFHKEFKNTQTPATKVTEKDLKFLEEVKSKM